MGRVAVRRDGWQVLATPALPVLWHDQVVGWANLSARDGELASSVGYAGKSLARDKVFRGALEDELQRMAEFL